MYSRAYLYAGMIAAANLSAFAIYLCFYLSGWETDYFFCLGLFLGFRVLMYMGTKSDELTPDFVHYLSVQRSLWAMATIAVTIPMILLKLSLQALGYSNI